MSSTLLLPPRAQFCNRSCSNKTHTHFRLLELGSPSTLSLCPTERLCAHLPHQYGPNPWRWYSGWGGRSSPLDNASASGNSTLVMLVVMLVERVFLVSGVVKALFSPNKKNRRFFFFFHHEQKKVKADFVGVSKSPLFATETQRIYSKLFFLFRKKFSLEHVLFSFLFRGRKFYARVRTRSPGGAESVDVLNSCGSGPPPSWRSRGWLGACIRVTSSYLAVTMPKGWRCNKNARKGDVVIKMIERVTL